MKDQRLKELLEKYFTDSCSPADLEELENWYHKLHFKDENEQNWADSPDLFYADFRQRLHSKKQTSSRKFRSLYIYASSAAAVLIILSGIWFSISEQSAPESIPGNIDLIGSIKPGGNRAVLTLADGSTISLSDADSGILAEQTGITIYKTAQGQLVYKSSSMTSSDGAMRFNTIETPRGGQFQVVLPDGSKVWLNAASSLRYPIAFSSAKREVELRGEAYFEISSDKLRPFIVQSPQQRVEVLGTHFNVNAYAEESSVITSLLEGSVMVSAKGGGSKTIRPGQQTDLDRSGALKVSSVNAAQAAAWKDGKFIFRKEPLEKVMRKLSRWYNVEILYENGIPEKTVWGEVSRFDQVSDVLELIEMSKVARFRIERNERNSERRIVVMK